MSNLKIQKLPVFLQDPERGVSNEYPTSANAFRQPCLWYISAVRNSGKSYLASRFLAQATRDKTFNKIYMVTPSFSSNKAYFGKYVDETDVYQPTKSSIADVIARVENDRDEWEDYLRKVKLYERFVQRTKHNQFMSDDDLLFYYDYMEKPKYKYSEPVKSLLILDDVINSPAILQSSGLGKLASLNRHVAPLKEEYNGRSSCGLAVIILSQSYRCSQGVGRLLRENLSLFTMFKNKSDAQMKVIEEEIGSVIDLDRFRAAYDYATEEKYGNLTVDFNPKTPNHTFRKNLNELLIFEWIA